MPSREKGGFCEGRRLQYGKPSVGASRDRCGTLPIMHRTNSEKRDMYIEYGA